MDALFGTFILVFFDIFVIGLYVAGLIYWPVSWIIPTLIFLTIGVAMYKPHKNVISWWKNKLSTR